MKNEKKNVSAKNGGINFSVLNRYIAFHPFGAHWVLTSYFLCGVCLLSLFLPSPTCLPCNDLQCLQWVCSMQNLRPGKVTVQASWKPARVCSAGCFDNPRVSSQQADDETCADALLRSGSVCTNHNHTSAKRSITKLDMKIHLLSATNHSVLV